MRHRVTSVQRHGDRGTARLKRAKQAYFEQRGLLATCQRAREIAALPIVHFKGRQLRTIKCTGDTGKGPHDQNVEEALLWTLIDLRAYRCPFHA